MSKGLGAVTNMNDMYPWGFWLGFDLLGGVAMAAGGFIIATAIYLFNWKKYKPIGRPAILTAFLGYLMAVIAIFLDIGHPFRLWHPSIMWQVHSVMWIVAIHVILYTTTLALEASPMFFEKVGMKNALNTINRIMIGAVIFGVMLSTLHQSSLGAVFLIAPSKMSPLWFSTFLPYLFLVSCIAMGMAMVSTETMLSAKAFNHKIDKEIYFGLARGMLNTLVIYFILKIFFLFKDAGIDGTRGSHPYPAAGQQIDPDEHQGDICCQYPGDSRRSGQPIERLHIQSAGIHNCQGGQLFSITDGVPDIRRHCCPRCFSLQDGSQTLAALCQGLIETAQPQSIRKAGHLTMSRFFISGLFF
jgi:formate-dependent nitrite reductase membrane component NrfD